jgi:hypothetical protein
MFIKKIFAAVLIAVFLLTSIIAVSAESVYIGYPMDGGGFEVGNIWSASGDAVPEIVEGDAPEGYARCFKFTNDSGYVSFWGAAMNIDEADGILKTGDKIKAEAWVKVSGELEGNYQFMITARSQDVNPGGYNKSDNLMELTPNTWTKITLEDTIPDGGGDYTFVVLSFEGEFSATIQIAGISAYYWGETPDIADETPPEEAPVIAEEVPVVEDTPPAVIPEPEAPAVQPVRPVAPKSGDNLFIILGLLTIASVCVVVTKKKVINK